MRPKPPRSNDQPGGADLAALDGMEEVKSRLHLAGYHDRPNIGNGLELHLRDTLLRLQLV